MKRILRTALLLLLCLTLYCCLVPAAHAEEVASGEWGDLHWTLDDAGLLTISGEGEMRNFSDNSTDAWRAGAGSRWAGCADRDARMQRSTGPDAHWHPIGRAATHGIGARRSGAARAGAALDTLSKVSIVPRSVKADNC